MKRTKASREAGYVGKCDDKALEEKRRKDWRKIVWKSDQERLARGELPRS